MQAKQETIGKARRKERERSVCDCVCVFVCMCVCVFERERKSEKARERERERRGVKLKNFLLVPGKADQFCFVLSLQIGSTQKSVFSCLTCVFKADNVQTRPRNVENQF